MAKRKPNEQTNVNQWVAAFCGLILGILLEAILGGYAWMETGPMLRFQSGVRLPVIGPLLGGALAYLFALHYGQVKLKGALKHSIMGAIAGLLIGYVLGALVLAPLMAQQDPYYNFLRSKVTAGYTRYFILNGMPLCGIIGCLIGLIYSVKLKRR
ncbi:hypothetical protein [Gimesia panareensis]|uniref:Uncharacterized protein n=1 Tax=Gimesia panareensis TaxID=2527978 RepID=A0A517QBL0_9PLAN|nr:hypothetical protein [Gimesia panareensis]QDT29011.1 hypothetical protein Enr10x_43600 [Gimesia panareensis]QDU51863.1 hypothetical protein Pan110_42330 [Gimesia panareensis]